MTGQEVKQRRLKMGMTQEELAEAVGVSGQTIRNIEADRFPPQNPRMLHLALSYLEMTRPKKKPKLDAKAIHEAQLRRWQSGGKK